MKYLLRIWPQSLFVFLYVLATIGCTHTPAAVPEEVHVPQPAPVQEVLIHEAREEASLLRSELAMIKIATAKQQAELQSALNQLNTLKEREEAFSANMQSIKENLLAAENERDQLHQEKIELQAQSAALPDLQQLIAEVQTVQTSVYEMMANMETLMTEVVQIKHDMKQTQSQSQRGTPNLTAFSMTTSSNPRTNFDTWTVSAGDTLWHIAQQHGISVDDLMDMNALQSDVIVEGQALKIPQLAAHQPDQEQQEADMPEAEVVPPTE
ncbi:LysM peptidoglycan-binding domain-containing protein [Nitrospira sp. M1]